MLRPHGVAILSDIHPFTMLGGALAGFPDDDITKGVPFVRNRTHLVSTYLTSFRTAGFTIDERVEVPVGEREMTSFPSDAMFPDATRQAFWGAPYLLIWRLTRA